MHTSLRAAVVLALALSSCRLPNSKIEGHDNAAIMPSGRLSFELHRSRDADSGAQTAAPRRYEFHVLLDIDASHGSGEFTDHVVAPDVISVGGPQFTGDVDVEFRLFQAWAAVRASNHFANGLGLDGFLGVSTSDLHIELTQGNVSDRNERDAWGPIVGATLWYSAVEWLRFFVEGSSSFGTARDVESISVTTLDLGAAFALGPHAQLVAGWRRVDYDAELDDFVASDMELRLSGPLIALRVGL